MPRKSAAQPATKAGPVRKAAAKSAKATPGKTARASAKAAPAAPLKTAAKAAAKAVAVAAPRSTGRPRAAAAPAPQLVRSQEERLPLVRDSFTMPEPEYAVLLEVKQACLRAGIDVKKSELLRIAVALLGQIDVATLKRVLATLPQLKTGRPSGS